MEKIIDFNESVYNICTKYPEVIEVLKELGFKDIAIPAMLNTAGKIMTIEKGSAMKKIDMELIKKKFEEAGFQIKE